MSTVSIPHIHKIEGDAGFWAKITKEGKVEDLKIQTLEGLRQIEGLMLGRHYTDIPIIVSRICGICPVVHILNACRAVENALGIRVSERVEIFRRIFLASQIAQSHVLHLFFMSLGDFVGLENDLDLQKEFPQESEAAIKIRDFSLRVTRIIGGRVVHPVTPDIGGFRRTIHEEDLEKCLDDYPQTVEAAAKICRLVMDIKFPEFQRKTKFASLASDEEYAYYKGGRIKIGEDEIPYLEFYFEKMEENLRNPPVKRVTFEGEPFMLGSIARVANSGEKLNPVAKSLLEEFIAKKGGDREKVFQNTFHNIFFQAVDAVHFLEETQILINKLKETRETQNFQREMPEKINSGLSAMEAPRGTLFTYFEIGESGRIEKCNIITPTAQFLNNLEADLKAYLPSILDLPKEIQEKKIRTLIRVYDPCISCATH